jgi:hypothetical protein
MRTFLMTGIAATVLASGIAVAGPAPDSKRLGHAKEFIADEQWSHAIAELKAAADDPQEKNRDEALFWLAHSEHQSGDDAAALQTIVRLEREYPSSRWVRQAQSIQVEIAQRMQRDDVLWLMAAPPAPPMPPPAPTPGPAVTALPRRLHAGPAATPATPATPPTPVAPSPPPSPMPFAVAPPATAAPAPPAPATTPAATASGFWVGVMPEPANQVVRIEALAGLIDAHSDRVIPLLKEIALDRNSPDEARRAVFVLARSPRPEAHNTVLEVARAGAEPVQLAAIREAGRFQDVNVSTELMRVYQAAGTPRVKRQVVTSLGERADDASLLRIVKTEPDSGVRNIAIMTLGRIPTARPQLRLLYGQAPAESREAVMKALLAARDDDELIRIASTEKNPVLRQRARQQLGLLATPKAVKYLTDNP